MTDNITLPRATVQQALEALEYTTTLVNFLLRNEKDIGPMLKANEAIHALRVALEQQQAEPVGSLSVRYYRGIKSMTNTDFDYNGDLPEGDYELYTAPPQRKPLTDEDIEQAQRTVWRSLPSDFDYTTSSWIEIGIRYAEAAHGIKEGT